VRGWLRALETLAHDACRGRRTCDGGQVRHEGLASDARYAFDTSLDGPAGPRRLALNVCHT
jgi:hypothetical protein